MLSDPPEDPVAKKPRPGRIDPIATTQAIS
jgi:hypothetical protein